MNQILTSLKSQVQSKLSSYPQCRSVIKLIQTHVSQLIRQVIKSVTSVQMLLFQRDIPEAIVQLDTLKCDCLNLEIYYKKGYDIEAQKQIKRTFQKEASYLSQQILSGIMSQENIKPRLSSREKNRISSRKKQIANGEDSNSKCGMYFENKKTRRQETNEQIRKSSIRKGKSILESSSIKSRLVDKEKKQVLGLINRTLNVPPSAKRKIFK